MEYASELASTGNITFGVRLDRARISGMAALPPTAEVSRRGRLGWSVPGTDPRLKTQPAGPGSVGAPRCSGLLSAVKRYANSGRGVV